MCDPILVTLLTMRLHYSQSSRENATPSSDTSPLASYKEVPPPPHPNQALLLIAHVQTTPYVSTAYFGQLLARAATK